MFGKRYSCLCDKMSLDLFILSILSIFTSVKCDCCESSYSVASLALRFEISDWAPPTVMNQFDLYHRVNSEVMDSNCFVDIMKRNISFIQLQSGCNAVKGGLTNGDNILQLVDLWTIQRNDINSFILFCDVVKNSAIQQLNIISKGGERIKVNSPQFACNCYQYDFILEMKNGKTNVRSFKELSCKRNHSAIFQTVGNLERLDTFVVVDFPMYELHIDDIKKFPGLRHIYIKRSPVTILQDGLFCFVPELRFVSFNNSIGNLKEFPRQIFSCNNTLNITLIDISSHPIDYLPEHAFGQAAKNVLYVILDDLQLKAINALAFDKMEKLQILTLTSSELKSLSEFVFQIHLQINYFEMFDFPQLTECNVSNIMKNGLLNLEYFGIGKTACTNLIGQFHVNNHCTLKLAYFANNNISSLHDDIFIGCFNLQYIFLHNNNLVYLPGGLFIPNMTVIKGLDVANNSLDNTTDWKLLIGHIHSLKWLNISYNNLIHWDYVLELNKLIHLDLSNNMINNINAKAFKHMNSLEKLLLQNNKISFIEIYSFESLTYLEELYLSHNLLTYSHFYVPTLCSVLQKYDISYNYIKNASTINSSCGNYRYANKMDVVYFHHNEILSLRLNCSQRKTYKLVDASSNEITSFYDIFKSNGDNKCIIEELNLSNNPIQSFLEAPEDFTQQEIRKITDENYHQVYKFNLQNCSIINIAFDTFYYFRSIKTIDLRHNHIVTMDELLLSGFSPQISVNLEANKLICDCQLLWLKHNLFDKHRSVSYIAETCYDMLSEYDSAIKDLKDDYYVCDSICPTEVVYGCDTHNCFVNQYGINNVMAVKCSSNTMSKRFPSGLKSVVYRIALFNFNLSDLKLPFIEETTLCELQITRSSISNIYPNTFEKTLNLKVLELSDNKLSSILEFAFLELKQLEYLDLSQNSINFIHKSAFSHLSKLNDLYLDTNELASLDSALLSSLDNIPLQLISLFDNPWNCNCSDSLKSWILHNGHLLFEISSVLCAETGLPVYLSNETCYEERLVLVNENINVFIIAPIICLLIILLCVFTVYINRMLFAVILYTFCPVLCIKNRNEEGDVFAIYDDQDLQVRLFLKDHLIPHIEPKSEVICYDKDFIGGLDMADNIKHAIDNTNCAILILTEGFLLNIWSMAMFQAVYTTIMERKRPYKVVTIIANNSSFKNLIRNENCTEDLKRVLKTKQYLRMNQRLFWESLDYLLPTKHNGRMAFDETEC